MYDTRQPITGENWKAHNVAAIASLATPCEARPYSPVRIRDPRETLVQLFLENPQTTYDEAREYLDERQIARYTPEARREAKRRSERQAA